MNKLEIYQRQFTKSLPDAFADDHMLEKSVFNGLRMVVHMGKPETYEQLRKQYHLSELVLELVNWLTPRKFTALFPIDKDFDGKRWETKDFFSTVEAIDNHGWDEPISDAVEFLWDYHNHETREFLVKYMGLVSDLRRMQGQPGILDEWAAQSGVHVFHLYSDQVGSQYIIDENGRSKPVRKANAKHLRLVQ